MNIKESNVNEVLDMLIRTRRSVRNFTNEVPSKELVEQIVEAGRLAPYAILAVAKQNDFRHFIVISKNTPAIDKIKSILKDLMKSQISKHEKDAQDNKTLQSYITSLSMQVEKGALGVGSAPYLIIVAERHGIPPIEQKSLSHIMQNMWLKTTALGLGFGLVSAIGRLSDNKEFCDIIGLPIGEYGFDACTVGFQVTSVNREGRDIPYKSIKWID
jgi:nitroreductase